MYSNVWSYNTTTHEWTFQYQRSPGTFRVNNVQYSATRNSSGPAIYGCVKYDSIANSAIFLVKRGYIGDSRLGYDYYMGLKHSMEILPTIKAP